MDILKNNHQKSLKDLKTKIAQYNKTLEFEKSKRLNEYLENLDIIFETIKTRFHEKKYEHDIFVAITPTKVAPRDKALEELSTWLELDKTIKTIDCFDISHFQSSYLVGSCIRFSNGVPDKNNFRRFKIKTLTTQNDYAALQEIISRRYKDAATIPDLIVIDGGKGQLSAAQSVLPHATIISLAKREETIFSDMFPHGKKLDIHTAVGQLLIAIRDYAHHFAISYHKLRRKKDMREK
jgi:excinuclease ABC subunit C